MSISHVYYVLLILGPCGCLYAAMLWWSCCLNLWLPVLKLNWRVCEFGG